MGPDHNLGLQLEDKSIHTVPTMKLLISCVRPRHNGYIVEVFYCLAFSLYKIEANVLTVN